MGQGYFPPNQPSRASKLEILPEPGKAIFDAAARLAEGNPERQQQVFDVLQSLAVSLSEGDDPRIPASEFAVRAQDSAQAAQRQLTEILGPPPTEPPQ